MELYPLKGISIFHHGISKQFSAIQERSEMKVIAGSESGLSWQVTMLAYYTWKIPKTGL